MKSILVIVLVLFAAPSFGQNPELNMDRLKKYLDGNKQQPGISPKSYQKQLSPLLLKRSMFDTVQYSHTTPHGDVFLLPQDGMFCLKPDSASLACNTPNAFNGNKPGPVDQMPNAFRGKPLVLVNPGWKDQPLSGDKK
ncbi:MAG: hypothetical protein V4722_27730 [Bacteroidota bacterium]